MYRIVDLENKEIGIASELQYIRYKEANKCFIPAKPYDATGISFKGKAYQLIGRELTNSVGAVKVYYVADGDLIQNLEKSNAELDAQLAETDEAAIELYEANIVHEEHNAEQDEAIIQIYEMIGEITNG